MQKAITTISFLFFFTCLQAQEVEVTASAPGVVAEGEQFRISFSVNDRADDFTPPGLGDFYILMGPSSSYNQSTQIINGKMTRSVSYTYTYVLQAVIEGEFTIGPAKFSVKNKTYSTNSLKIEVVKGTKPDVAPAGQNPILPADEAAKASSEDLFLRVLVDKTSVYQGEHIIATVKIYSRVNLSGFENARFPSFPGFLREDIETPPLRSLERENVNGVIYGTGVLQRVVLFPQRSGELEIDPMELECLVQQRVQRNARSFFDDFFDSYQNIKQVIKSPPVKIRVKPLPGDTPDSFRGAVGSLKMDVTTDKTELKENDALTLKITLSGNGNLKLLESPRIDFPPDFETYDPKVSSNLVHTTSGSSGNKTFEYLTIPRHAGNYRIPPVTFTYFDPSGNDYITLESREFNIKVLMADEAETGTVISGFSKEDLRFIGSDIRFIKNGKIKLQPRDKPFFGSLRFYLFYILPLILFVVLVTTRRRHIRRNADHSAVRNRKANKIARKRLKAASIHMKSGDYGRFYEELLKALWGYLSDKLGIPVSDLSKESSRDALGKKQVDAEMIDDLIDMISICEYTRYAPAGEVSQTEATFRKATRIISLFEQKLK